MALTKTDIALIKEAIANPSTPAAVRRLLLEKYAPPSEDDPLTVTNSVILHLAARVTYLEMRLTRLLAELEAPDEGQEAATVVGNPGAVPAGATVTEDEEGEAVVVNNARVVSGAVMPSGPGGAVQGAAPAGGGGPVRAADATPFPAGVAASAPPGTGQKTTVVASAPAEAPAPAASSGGKKK